MSRDPEFDEIDALLSGEVNIDDLLGGPEETTEENELDALLGSIDDDFLSSDEEILLANKAYLATASAADLDATFMKQQEALMNNIEDILEEYSGGCMTGEHFGLDTEQDELDDLDDDLDVLEFGLDGSCNSCGSHNDCDCEIEGSAYTRQDIRNIRKSIRQERRTGRQEARQERRTARLEKKAQRIISRATTPLFEPKKERRQERRLERKEVRQDRRLDQKFNQARTKYLRLASNLKDACMKFKNLGGNSPIIMKNMSAVAPASMAINPFQVAASVYVSNFPGVASTVNSSLTKRPFSPKGNKRSVQIMKAARICDEKYDRLVESWKRLNKLGNTSGLQSPRVIVSSSFGWMKKSIDTAQKKTELSQKEKSVIRKNRLLEKRRLRDLQMERKQQLMEQRERRQRIAEERKAQMTLDAKKEAQSEYDSLASMTSYIDEADLKGLERAALARKQPLALPSPEVRQIAPRVVRRSKPQPMAPQPMAPQPIVARPAPQPMVARPAPQPMVARQQPMVARQQPMVARQPMVVRPAPQPQQDHLVRRLKMAEEKRGQLEKDLGRAKESLILAQKMKSNPVVIKKHQQEVASLAGQIKVQNNKIQQIKMAR